MAPKHQPPAKLFDDDSSLYGVSAAESIYTYASSVSSDDEDLEPPVEVVRERYVKVPSVALPSNPPTFGELFPSTTRLVIKHDDSTLDGNMNLQVNTFISEPRERQCEVTLYHFRMYNLHNRKFSFRRYCRDSGREVCHTSRKRQHPKNEALTAIQRPLGSALSNFLPNTTRGSSLSTALKRRDSGYKSGLEEADSITGRQASMDSSISSKPSPSTNTILLEFSNYAHVDVKRRGSKSRYAFEYWGAKYQWKKSVWKEGDTKETCYDLYHSERAQPVAHIMPDQLSSTEALTERRRGGWIPPSSMWISDPSVYKGMKDVADVIVATGLVALTDDCIEQRWHREETTSDPRHVSPKNRSLLKSMERLTSNRLIDKMLHRRDTIGLKHATSFRQLLAGTGQGGYL